MRVLALLSAYPTETEPLYGIYHGTQVEAVARCGVEIEVVAPVPWVPPGLGRFSSKWRRYERIPASGFARGVRIHRPRYLEVPRGNLWAAPHLAFARCGRRFSTVKPDLVHSQIAYPCGLAGLRLASRWAVPSVLTLHGSDVNVYPYQNGLSRRRFREAVLGSDRVLAVSEALANRAEALSGRRPEVMPIGIDLRRFSGLPEKSLARRQLNLPEGRRVVLYVGNLYPQKGIAELLEALRILGPEGVFGAFVGDGEMRDQVASVSTAAAFGIQPSARVALFMAAADVLVLPSYSEGMPTVLIEAAAARLPVVATHVGGVPELLSGDRGLLIGAKSVEEIVNGVRLVLSDPVSAELRAGRLAAFVQANYNVDRNAESLVGIYAELLDRVGRGRVAASG